MIGSALADPGVGCALGAAALLALSAAQDPLWLAPARAASGVPRWAGVALLCMIAGVCCVAGFAHPRAFALAAGEGIAAAAPPAAAFGQF